MRVTTEVNRWSVVDGTSHHPGGLMRMRKVWTALALVFVTSLGVHSAGAQAEKKATKSAKSDTTKKAATTVAPAGKSADAKATTSDAPNKAGATKSVSKSGATK